MGIFQKEEKKKETTYDLKINRWLLGFLNERKLYFSLSLILMIVTAGLEISIPYLTKKAVDSYIYPSWGKTARNNFSKIKFADSVKGLSIINLDDGTYLINLSGIKSKDKTEIEKTGVISKKRYLVVDEGSFDSERKKKFLDIINSDKVQYQKKQNLYIISHSEIEKLDAKEISLLRFKEIIQLKKLVLTIFLCVIGIFLTTTSFTYLLYYSGHKIMHSIRMKAFSKIIRLPQNYFDKNPVGRITTRVTNDVNAINEMYTSVMVQFIKDILVVVGIIAIMLNMNVELTLIIIGLTIFLAIVAMLFRMRLKTVFRNIRITIGKLNAFVQESIRGIILIKLYGREEKNLEKFREINGENLAANMNQLWTYVFFRPFIEYVSILGTGLILWYGGINVIKLNLTLGSLIAFLYYVRMVFKPIQELSEKYNIFQSAAAASENLYEIITHDVEKNGITIPGETQGILEFRNVWFSYNQKDWVLKNVSFKISPGETAALVGLTGSGKTTVVNLILKFYEVGRGEILFNGININELDNRYLRKEITAIFQDLFLFGKDISEDKVDPVQIRNEYSLKQNGNSNGKLSSGENQIVSLSKAFKKNSSFLIMDEATSHIDAEIEKKIQNKIKEDNRSQTKLIIAHRLSNVRNADKIFVIHKGEIVEEGDHDTLIQNRKIYYTLNNFQKKTTKLSTV
ncbi:MAG: ABC transporter ATP-binding protein [Thermodesulfobacteriota bacterium]